MLEKNPDEFYFGMMKKSGPSTQGKKATGTLNGDRGNQVLNQEAVRLFKTQDLGYVRTMRNKTQKEVDQLKRRVMGIEAEGERIVFVEGDKEDLEDRMEEEVQREEEEEDAKDEEREKKLNRVRDKEQAKLEAQLEMAEKRLESLMQAEEALDLARKKMAKTMSVGGTNKNGVKFKVRERKR